jgi:hypothetical protein
MPIRKVNLLRLARLQKRLWGGVLVIALLAASSVCAFATPTQADAESPPHVTAPAWPTTQLQRDLAQARAAQARYDLPKLLSIARDCRNLALKLHKLQAERVCDDAMFGAAQRLGDARSMVEADYWWQQNGFSAADQTSKATFVSQAPNLARLIDTVPAFSAKVVVSSSVLNYQHRIEFAGHVAAEPLTWHRPTVTAAINGKPVAVLVDTGTALPLMMDQTHATALGAIPLMGGWAKPGMIRNPPTGTKGFTTALITSFKFGGLVMHNVAATIVPDGTFHVGVLVGLPVLARFGRVDLNDARIATGLAVHCTSGVPLRLVGEGQLGFSTIADGSPAIAMVDTGSMYALFAKQGESPGSSIASKTSLRESPEIPPAHRRRVRVQIGAWSMTGVGMPDAKITLPPGVDVSIGAPLLAFADVRIDFAKPSLCVSPKPSVKDGAVFVYRDRREGSIEKDPVVTLLVFLKDFLTKMALPSAAHEGRAAHAQ